MEVLDEFELQLEVDKKEILDRKNAIERVKSILLAHGIVMKIGSCGCCNSPWVKMAYEGELVLDAEDVNFSMFLGEE